MSATQKTMQEKFTVGLRELINMCLNSEMHPVEMLPALAREIEWCRAACEQRDPRKTET